MASIFKLPTGNTVPQKSHSKTPHRVPSKTSSHPYARQGNGQRVKFQWPYLLNFSFYKTQVIIASKWDREFIVKVDCGSQKIVIPCTLLKNTLDSSNDQNNIIMNGTILTFQMPNFTTHAISHDPSGRQFHFFKLFLIKYFISKWMSDKLLY